MCKPSIIMIGVPNSGTSIMAKLYNVLGWNFEPDENDLNTGRDKGMHLGWLSRSAGIGAVTSDPTKLSAAKHELQEGFTAATKPVIAKQHNLSWCLDTFTDIILSVEPKTVLVLVEKELRFVQRSTQLRLHRADPSVGWLNRKITAWVKAARRQYDKWPAAKYIIQYATVQDAVTRQDVDAFACGLKVGQYNIDTVIMYEAMKLFDPHRNDESNPNRGLFGWEYPRVDD